MMPRDAEQLFEDVVMSKVRAGDALMTAALALTKALDLIAPYEPEMVEDIRTRFHQFAFYKGRNRKKFCKYLGEFRDSLMVAMALIHQHAISDPDCDTEHLVDGFATLIRDLEQWAQPIGLKPARIAQH